MSDNNINVLAGYMKAFSSPLRLKIIYQLLDSEKSVTEMVENLQEKQCTISMQLKFLTERNILSRRQIKRYVYYSIKERHVPQLLNMISMSVLGSLN